jgi:hypothetical protein
MIYCLKSLHPLGHVINITENVSLDVKQQLTNQSNTPKYVTLQKLTAKIEHCLNIFLYLYSLVCTFLLYFFPK